MTGNTFFNMGRHGLGLTVLAACPALLSASPASSSAAHRQNGKDSPGARRPNIVVILADDLLSSELGCYGGRNIKTPNIDRLAAEGVRFTHNFASQAISCPIRASLYTGLYPARHGTYQNHKYTFPGTRTVNEYMADEGYRVGRTGKTHPSPASVYKFEEIPGFVQNCVAKEAPFSTDGIKEWIEKDAITPFCLFVCSINPHAPWTWGDPSEFCPDSLKMPEICVDSPAMRRIFCKYLAEVRALDNEVGAVMEVLETTGKLDDTIVMFLGENGPQFPGGKWTLWYPGVGSALIARYPRGIRPGTVCDAIVQYEDILPTFIDIAGGRPRKELDGVSFKSALFGKSDRCRKYAYGIHNNITEGRPYPVRSIRDRRYALILNLLPDSLYFEKGFMTGKSAVWSAYRKAAETDPQADFLCRRYLQRPAVEFYDLENDPWEMDNLAGRKEYRRRIARMRKALEKWMESQGDPGIPMDVPFVNQ